MQPAAKVRFMPPEADLLARSASTASPPSHSAASTGSPPWRAWLPGLALTAAIAALAMQLGRQDWFQARGISAITLAIVLGMLVGNTVYGRVAPVAAAGVGLSKTRLLRLGIVLYGVRLTFQDIGNVGWAGFAIDALVLCSTFGIACVLGTRVFGLDPKTAMLIGAGSSICGAAAVMATEPVVRGKAEQVAVAVATVVVFGTVAIFLYPMLYRLEAVHALVPMTQSGYGLFVGSTVHEVAQVVAAGRAVGEQAADTAVIAKMVRVMMLAPFLIVLSAWLSRRPGGSDMAGTQGTGGIVIPWFALGFVAVAGFNSLALLPPAAIDRIVDIDTVLLSMAMAGLGLTTHVSAIRKAGARPLALAALLFAWLVVGGLAINAGVARLWS